MTRALDGVRPSAEHKVIHKRTLVLYNVRLLHVILSIVHALVHEMLHSFSSVFVYQNASARLSRSPAQDSDVRRSYDTDRLAQPSASSGDRSSCNARAKPPLAAR